MVPQAGGGAVYNARPATLARVESLLRHTATKQRILIIADTKNRYQDGTDATITQHPLSTARLTIRSTDFAPGYSKRSVRQFKRTPMIEGKKVVVVMPAYNAASTLKQTLDELPAKIVDDVVLVDDQSHDETAKLAETLGLFVHIHPQNRGYGGNQKSCYRLALERDADIVVMVHPDYQYSPRLVAAMASMIASGHYDLVLGSRILGGSPLKGGMPYYKYIANRCLTAFENILLGAKLSEYHSGLRAYSRNLLETLPLERNSEDFIFDNEVLAQTLMFGYEIGEISCPTRYFAEASSIGFVQSCLYGLGVLRIAVAYRLHRWGLKPAKIFEPIEKKLQEGSC